MSLYKRVILAIIRRPFYTCMLCLAIVVTMMMMVVGNLIGDAVNAYKNQFAELQGYSIYVRDINNQKQTGRIEQRIIDKIMSIEHIEGYNMYASIECIPENFNNVSYDEKEISKGLREENRIRFIANLNTEFFHTFRNEMMILKEGNYPSEKNQGILIADTLAEKNKLSIGSKVSILKTLKDGKEEFEIVGIYTTKEPPKEEVISEVGTYYKNAPYSYVFCDFTSYGKITDIADQLLQVYFYVDCYDNLQKVYDTIQSMKEIGNRYEVVNWLENMLSGDATVIYTLAKTSENTLKIVYLSAIVILLLLTVLWMKSHYYEAGIYIALGMQKWKIVVYFLFEVIMILIIALAVSSIWGYILVERNGGNVINTIMEFLGIQFRNQEVEHGAMKQLLSINNLLWSGFSVMIITIFTTLLSSISILRYNIRELFEGN